MKRFGPRSESVERFLGEVGDAGLPKWQRYVDRTPGPAAERRAAVQAMGRVALPAPVSTAIGKAALEAFRQTGLTSDMFPSKKARFLALPSDIELACTVIAAAEQVSTEHANALLGPFADAGFRAASDTLVGSPPSETAS